MIPRDQKMEVDVLIFFSMLSGEAYFSSCISIVDYWYAGIDDVFDDNFSIAAPVSMILTSTSSD